MTTLDRPQQIDPSLPAQDAVAELSRQLAAAEAQIANLEVALASSRVIGGAIGIVMATRGLTQDDAFELLRQASQTRNRKLREVAEDVVLMGAVPGTP